MISVGEKTCSYLFSMLTSLVLMGSEVRSQIVAEVEDPWEDRYSVNSYGGIGLIQTRTARFSKDGEFYIGASFINPYRRYYLTWQIFPFMEATFRYMDPTNSVSDGSIYGRYFGQSDRVFFSDVFNFRNKVGTRLSREADIKIKLLSETRYRPAVALGLQDFIGTSDFAGEYIVANKRFGSFDISFGIGWGYLGSRGDFPNIIRLFGSRFDYRTRSGGTGGEPQIGRWFAGETIGFFGGIEYFSDIDGLSVKLEFNGADAEKENDVRFSPDLRETLPVNIAVNYQPTNWIDVAVGFERGNALMLRASINTNLNSTGVDKLPLKDPAVIPRQQNIGTGLVSRLGERNNTSARTELREIYSEAASAGWEVEKLSLDYNEAKVSVSLLSSSYSAGSMNKLAQLLFRGLPRFVNTLNVKIDEVGASSIYIFEREASRLVSAFDSIFRSIEWQGMGFSQISVSENELIFYGDSETSNDFDLLLKNIESINADLAQIFDAISVYEISHEISGVAPKLVTLSSREGRVRENLSISNSDAQLSAYSSIEEDEVNFAELVMAYLPQYGYWIYSVSLEESNATIYLSNTVHWEQPKNVGRVARLVANFLPNYSETITVVELIAGIEIYRQTVLRSDLEREAVGRISTEELWLKSVIDEPRGGLSSAKEGLINNLTYPAKNWWITPELKQHVGDPSEGLYLADINLELGASFSPIPGLNFTIIAQKHILGSLDQLSRVSDSVLPHVRSDLVKYLTQGRTSLNVAQVDYMGAFGRGLYYRVAAGIFESMYGGIGSQILYRPWGKDWAASLEIDWAKKRDFNQRFRFRDYSVITGHLTIYHELPWLGLRSAISAGRYLARDYGMTFDISRRFNNGVRVGAFATFTNVSAEDFGEGSFDKGFYIKIPMGLFIPNYSKQTASFGFRPLTRDGGAKLNIGPDLFEFVNRGNLGFAEDEWLSIGIEDNR